MIWVFPALSLRPDVTLQGFNAFIGPAYKEHVAPAEDVSDTRRYEVRFAMLTNLLDKEDGNAIAGAELKLAQLFTDHPIGNFDFGDNTVSADAQHVGFVMGGNTPTKADLLKGFLFGMRLQSSD